METKISEPRWTHVALPVADRERSIEFYEALTPLVVVARHETENGRGAWLSNPRQVAASLINAVRAVRTSSSVMSCSEKRARW